MHWGRHDRRAREVATTLLLAAAFTLIMCAVLVWAVLAHPDLQPLHRGWKVIDETPAATTPGTAGTLPLTRGATVVPAVAGR